jgi:transposase
MSDQLRCRKVYRFGLEPVGRQDLELERTASVSGFIYNWGLDRCQTYYQANGKSLAWSQLSRELTELKRSEPWLYDFDSQMLQQALANLQRAYGNFFAGRARFPKFKEKKSARHRAGQRFQRRNEHQKGRSTDTRCGMRRESKRPWTTCKTGGSQQCGRKWERSKPKGGKAASNPLPLGMGIRQYWETPALTLHNCDRQSGPGVAA